MKKVSVFKKSDFKYYNIEVKIYKETEGEYENSLFTIDDTFVTVSKYLAILISKV